MAALSDRSAVPTVSLAGEAADPAAFARALGKSFELYGFAIVSGHGVAPALIAAAQAAARAFFTLPEAAKRRYHRAGQGGARGYTPFGVETARGAVAHDLKEFWHVGRELAEGHRSRARMPPNIWPDETPEFRDAALALYAALEGAGQRLLAAIARYLGLDADFFEGPTAEGNSVLRLLHYPPASGDGPSLRAAAHEDIDVITLLLGAEEAGLELLDGDGNWVPIRPRDGEMVVNVGDMLQRLTNHALRSTTHRVANPTSARAGVARYSMPFFLHFRPDYRIATLPRCVTPAKPDRYAEPILADDYLMRRLEEIKLL